MKFFLAAIVTAALLAEIIPVWAADPGNDKIKNKAPSVHTEADNSNGHPPEGIKHHAADTGPEAGSSYG